MLNVSVQHPESLSIGWARFLSHLTNRQIIILLSLSSKPAFRVMLCHAGVWMLQTSLFFASRLQLHLPVGAPEGDWKAGGGERGLLASQAYDVPQAEVVLVFSLLRHSQNQTHCIFLEIPASVGSAPTSKVGPSCLTAPHRSSFGPSCCAKPPSSFCFSISKDRSSFLQLL